MREDVCSTMPHTRCLDLPWLLEISQHAPLHLPDTEFIHPHQHLLPTHSLPSCLPPKFLFPTSPSLIRSFLLTEKEWIKMGPKISIKLRKATSMQRFSFRIWSVRVSFLFFLFLSFSEESGFGVGRAGVTVGHSSSPRRFKPTEKKCDILLENCLV